MTEQEAAEILVEIRKLRLLIVGNGNKDAVLPRLQALEFLAKALKLLVPIITLLIGTGLALMIFGK